VSVATTSQPIGEGGTLDFGRAFQYFFEDPDWVKKLLTGSLFQLLSILLVGIPFVVGYCLRIVGRVARGEPRPLPEWDDLGALFSEGLRGFGLYLVLLVGALLIPGAMGCVLAVMGGALSSASRDGSGGGEAMIGLGIMLVYGLALVVSLVVGLYVPAAFARMVIYDRFSAGFEFGENIAFIRRNLVNYLLVIVIQLLTHFIAQFACYLLCLPFFPASFWATCTSAWALGETVRRDPTLAPGGTLATY
jgi:hypothetical protein